MMAFHYFLHQFIQFIIITLYCLYNKIFYYCCCCYLRMLKFIVFIVVINIVITIIANNIKKLKKMVYFNLNFNNY